MRWETSNIKQNKYFAFYALFGAFRLISLGTFSFQKLQITQQMHDEGTFFTVAGICGKKVLS